MPRLSVIVPHINTDVALESTLLSLLEHRDQNCEVIVAHNGNYTDPYQLDGDEIILIDTTSQSAAELANEGIAAAIAPVVQILLPGTTVESLWYEAVLEAFSDYRLGAVAAAVQSQALKMNVVGLRASQLPRHQLVSDRESSELTYPLLNGGFFRRRLLQGLGGLMSVENLSAIETELAAALQSMDVICGRYDRAHMSCQTLHPETDSGYCEGQQMARVARGYAALSQSPIAIDSLPVRMGKLAASLFNPVSISHRLGWTLGLQDSSLIPLIRERVERGTAAWQSYLEEQESLQRRPLRRVA